MSKTHNIKESRKDLILYKQFHAFLNLHFWNQKQLVEESTTQKISVSVISKQWAGWLGNNFLKVIFSSLSRYERLRGPRSLLTPYIGYQALSEKTTRRGRKFHQFRPSTTEVKTMNLFITSDLRNSGILFTWEIKR
jgi:hypothetical protein